jgi:hypothetical protein
MTDINNLTPEARELIRRSVGTFARESTTRRYIDIDRAVGQDDPGDDHDD